MAGFVKHHYSFDYRVRRWARRHKGILVCVMVVVVCLAIGFLGALEAHHRQAERQVEAGKSYNAGSGYRNIVFQGEKYHYNHRITSILFVGLDSEGDIDRLNKYSIAPRADSIALIALDEMHKKMPIIALNRDTMTRIRKYTLSGKDRGMYRDHLGYAYTYGDGGRVSCENICEAVSELLYGIPVNDYIVINRTSMITLSEIIGSVVVTVPNDDLTIYGEQYQKDAVVTIDASNLEFFVRTRDINKHYSNEGRMERQQAYINGAIERIRGIVKNNPQEAWEMVQTATKSVRTNITKARYLDLVRVMNHTVYKDKDYYIPGGEHKVTDHDEFYPNEQELLQKVIEVFYIAD